MKQPPRIVRPRAALLLVDLQERLLPAMHEPERVLANALRLVQGAALLGLPVWVTEQYPQGLGPTVAPLSGALAEAKRFEKTTFSARGAAGLWETLRSRPIGDVLLAGIEAHVCVCQTGLDVLGEGFRVFAVADAMASRTSENWRFGLDRLRAAGAVVVSTEMALFELLGDARAPEFKAVQALVK